MYEFTADWVTANEMTWLRLLQSFMHQQAAGTPIRMLEIGSYEGRSSIWWMDNILTHPASSLTCIDPSPSHLFLPNITASKHSLRFIRNSSAVVLPQLIALQEKFSIIYIDGSHLARDVLLDGLLSLQLLLPEGIIIFDDYEWSSPSGKRPPKPAIDALINICNLTVLHRGWQVAVTTSVPLG